MKTFSMKMPDHLIARLDSLAQETGRTKTYYVKKLLEDHLEELEDIYLADEAMQDYIAKGTKSYTTAEVRKRLGLGR